MFMLLSNFWNEWMKQMYKKLIDRYKLYNFVLKLALRHKQENSILGKASIFKAAVKSVLSCKIVFHQFDIEWVSGAFRPKRNLRPPSHVFVVRVVSFGVWKKKILGKDLNVLLLLFFPAAASNLLCSFHYWVFLLNRKIYYPTRITNNAIFLDVI